MRSSRLVGEVEDEKVNRYATNAATHLERIDSLVNEMTKEFRPCALLPVGRVPPPAPRFGGSAQARARGLHRMQARAVWRLGASNYRSAFVEVRWQPRRQDSHVGAVDKGFGRAADLLVVILGEQVDRALAVEQAVLGVQPLADASRG